MPSESPFTSPRLTFTANDEELADRLYDCHNAALKFLADINPS